MTYRLKCQLLGIDTSGPQHKPVDIPDGSLVEVTGGPLDGTRLIHVIFDCRAYLMFTQDIREHADEVMSTVHP